MAKLGKVVCVYGREGNTVLVVSLDITSTSSAFQPTSPPPRGLYVQEGGMRALGSHSLTWALGLLHHSHPKSIQLHSLKLMCIELLLSIVVALEMLQVERVFLSVTVDTTVGWRTTACQAKNPALPHPGNFPTGAEMIYRFHRGCSSTHSV